MCDCDLPQVYERIERRARKVHTCDDCRFPTIAIGDAYTVHQGLWDGQWGRYKICRYCEIVRRDYMRNLPSDYCEPCLGDLWVYLSDAGEVEWIDRSLPAVA